MKLAFTMLICKRLVMLTIVWCVQNMSVPHCKTDGFKLFRHSPLIYNVIIFIMFVYRSVCCILVCNYQQCTIQ